MSISMQPSRKFAKAHKICLVQVIISLGLHAHPSYYRGEKQFDVHASA
jgi:hypothetical protein